MTQERRSVKEVTQEDNTELTTTQIMRNETECDKQERIEDQNYAANAVSFAEAVSQKIANMPHENSS